MNGARGSIIALAGRRVDAPKADARFPVASVGRVRRGLQERLATDTNCLVSSAACGADLLALETADRLSIPYHIVLPFPPSQFRKSSVIDRPGMSWGPLFDKLIAKAKRLDRLWVHQLDPGVEAFRKTNIYILDLARELGAEVVSSPSRADLRALLVWDKQSRGPDDITEHFRRSAEKRGFTIEEISTL